ncbi:MAG: RNA polymerase sigma factor [Phycisphaerales bacterium]|nr:RNA polymerase sigma factor [Phycisphaerales bacterium]
MKITSNNLDKRGSSPPIEKKSSAGSGKRANRSTVMRTVNALSKPQSRTDEQLMQSFCNGDKGSFDELMQRYQRELYHFLVRFLGNRSLAEDVFQETFLQVHQSAGQFDRRRKFRPWLFTIAANKARDQFRAQNRQPTSTLETAINNDGNESGRMIDLLQVSTQTPFEHLQEQEQRQLVYQMVMEMPENLREILILSYFHEFPYKQISDILAIPLGTVKSRLHSAVSEFADRWQAANLEAN